ncbi:hypothetical protein AMTRI_Chr07g81900 [Amborella trichopoda]
MKMRMVVISPFLSFILVLLIRSSGLSTVDLEGEALLNWKTSLKNHTLVSWFLESKILNSHCSWIGIKCNDGGRTLNHLNFFSLPHLSGLNLSLNHLEGKIPKSIGSLLNLSFMDLAEKY